MLLTFDPVIPLLDYVLKSFTKKHVIDMFEKLPAAYSLITIMETIHTTRRKYIKM